MLSQVANNNRLFRLFLYSFRLFSQVTSPQGMSDVRMWLVKQKKSNKTNKILVVGKRDNKALIIGVYVSEQTQRMNEH